MRVVTSTKRYVVVIVLACLTSLFEFECVHDPVEVALTEESPLSVSVANGLREPSSLTISKCYCFPPTLSEYCLSTVSCTKPLSLEEVTQHGEKPSAPQGVCFMTLGDWGQMNKHRDNIVGQMAINVDKFGARYVLLLGDNFYENGVKSIEDPLWNTFESLFSDKAFQEMPFYSVLGNHDYHYSPFSQVLYSLTPSSYRWYMPNLWYYTVHTYKNVPKKLSRGNPYKIGNNTLDTDDDDVDDESGTVDKDEPQNNKKHDMTVVTVFIDTQILSKSAMTYLHVDEEHVYVKHVAFLEQALAAGSAVADWLFVVGHYEIFGSGEHGDMESLKTLLLPMFRKYNVDAYFNGHEHFLELLYDEESGVHFYTSGSGSKLHQAKCTHEKCRFQSSTKGFTSHVLTRKRMYSGFLSEKGVILKKYKQKARKKIKATDNKPVLFPPLEMINPGSQSFQFRYLFALGNVFLGMLVGSVLTIIGWIFWKKRFRKHGRYVPIGVLPTSPSERQDISGSDTSLGKQQPNKYRIPERILGKLSPLFFNR